MAEFHDHVIHVSLLISDVWMLSCMTFVFCSLLELASIGYLSRDITPEKSSKTPKTRKKRRKRKLFGFYKSSPSVAPTTTDTALASDAQTPLIEKVQLDRMAPNHGILPPPNLLDDDDYGYRPPGLGLALNLHSTLSRYMLGAIPVYACSCSHRKSDANITIEEKPTDSVKVEAPQQQSANQMDKAKKEKMARKIDQISCIVFPTLFICFNIGYWNYYLGS